MQRLVLCKVSFFWVTNLSSVEILAEFNKVLFARPGQKKEEKAEVFLVPPTERIIRDWVLGHKG